MSDTPRTSKFLTENCKKENLVDRLVGLIEELYRNELELARKDRQIEALIRYAKGACPIGWPCQSTDESDGDERVCAQCWRDWAANEAERPEGEQNGNKL